MIKKLKLTILTLAIALGGFVPALVPVAVTHADNIQSNLCDGSKSASGSQKPCDNATIGSGEGIKTVAANVVKLISIIVGVISIIFIIYGGFRYITSGGDSGKVGNAKNTLIYAVIGLVVVALAQLIVNVVLSTANNATNGL